VSKHLSAGSPWGAPRLPSPGGASRLAQGTAAGLLGLGLGRGRGRGLAEGGFGPSTEDHTPPALGVQGIPDPKVQIDGLSGPRGSSPWTEVRGSITQRLSRAGVGPADLAVLRTSGHGAAGRVGDVRSCTRGYSGVAAVGAGAVGAGTGSGPPPCWR